MFSNAIFRNYKNVFITWYTGIFSGARGFAPTGTWNHPPSEIIDFTNPGGGLRPLRPGVYASDPHLNLNFTFL